MSHPILPVCAYALSCIFVTPRMIVCQAALSMQFFRQEYWSGLPFPSPGDLSHPEKTHISYFSCTDIWALYQLSYQGSPFSLCSVQFSHSVMSDFATPWITARQASLSITNSWSSLRPTSIESVMPSSHLILCRPLLLLPPIPPSIR